MGFSDIVLSLKAAEPAVTVLANRLAAKRSDYPLHLGVTAAGPRDDSLLKSAVALGSLLLDGIGDTIRISFTGDPAGEVVAGREILRAAGILRDRPEIISCPTCGRCRINLEELVSEVKAGLAGHRQWIRVAVMGCEVNGPGEARDADVGLASAGGVIHLFAGGQELGRVPRDKAVSALLKEVEKMA